MFLAVALDDDTRHALAARLAVMLPGGPPGRSVPPENWHLTLRYLGATSDVAADRVLAGLDDTLGEKPFPARLTTLGAFPRATAATVLWVGVDDPSASLARIAAACEEVARAVGFEPEERPFHPHVTVARLRPPRTVTGVVDGAPPAEVRLRVQAVTLFRSVPGGRMRYEVVDTVELAGR